jgi:hypothetical protein
VEVTLEKASEIDSEKLAEISKRAFDNDVDFGAPGNIRPPGYDSPAFYTRILRFLDSYRIMRDEEVAGGIMAKVVGKHGVLERIFVDPSLMRCRIGSEAVRLIEEAYPDVSLWSLGTTEWNTRTPQFYGKLGYTQIGWEHSEPDNRGRWYDKRTREEDPFIPIGNLRDGASNVLTEGRITEKGMPRMVHNKKTREALTVANAALEDDSGRIVMTLWGNHIDLLKIGGRIRVDGGYTNSYSGILQLNVGYGQLITLL